MCLTYNTEVLCYDGKLYLATVLDCVEGNIQSVHMADNMRAKLCVQALENEKTEGMILPSDWGNQFTSQLFCKTLRCYKIVQSGSGIGCCYDNARVESFFATLKKEKLYHIDITKLRREDIKVIISRYIHCYNLHLILSVNDLSLIHI